MRTIDVVPAGFTEFLRGSREKQGEDALIAQLAKNLDDTHVLLRHLILPNATDKLGFVLVGPQGIWHLELLHLASLVNNGGVWMYWDYAKQSIQPVPFNARAGQTRSRLAELQAFLGQSGFGARQAVVVTTPNAPRDFNLPGLDIVLFVGELGEFIREVMPQHATAAPLAVDEVVNLLTGKTEAKKAAPAGKAGGPGWLKQRHPRLGSMTGLQVLVLSVFGLLNCCALAFLARVLLAP
jgi:hypothetical protein